MFNSEQADLIHRLLSLSRRENLALYLVGGVVRDLLLGHTVADKDLDFIVEGYAPDFARKVADEFKAEFKQFPQFLTAKVLSPQGFETIQELDFASVRNETYERPGQLPVVSLARNIQEDLKRRDFSINALALPLSALSKWLKDASADLNNLRVLLLDQFGGLDDLDHKKIRILHPQSFIDDPTRLFRACRYAGRIGAQLESTSATFFAEAISGKVLSTISPQRKIREIEHFFSEINCADCLRYAKSVGLWDELNLVPREEYDHFIEAVSRFDKMKTKLSSAIMWEIGLAIIVRSNSEPQAELIFLEHGLGRKSLKRVSALLKEAENIVSENQNAVQVRILHALTAESDADFLKRSALVE